LNNITRILMNISYTGVNAMRNNFENDEEDEEELLEEICENGEPVFSMFWDSGAPTPGADCKTVYCCKVNYAVSSSSEGLLGPYDSLEVALRENDGLLMVTSSTPRASTVNPCRARRIATMLWSEADEPLTLKINGETTEIRERGRLPKGNGKAVSAVSRHIATSFSKPNLSSSVCALVSCRSKPDACSIRARSPARALTGR
jgi:hypothetical protein